MLAHFRAKLISRGIPRSQSWSDWVPGRSEAIMPAGECVASMQIVDLRQIHSRSLENLFREEAERWRDDLHWDYRPSIDLVRKFIDSRALGGYAAMTNGQPAGYGFYVLEDHKGLIGGLFVSSQHSQGPITERLLTEMLGAAGSHSAPGTNRGAVDAVRNRARPRVSLATLPPARAPVHAAISR